MLAGRDNLLSGSTNKGSSTGVIVSIVACRGGSGRPDRWAYLLHTSDPRTVQLFLDSLQRISGLLWSDTLGRSTWQHHIRSEAED